ncbi:MAG: DsbE family thiol:disulfide interchange protein [Alphaproteobacteria bacterium]|nr:DsbE family thiol:disulfide interchange protein [Alphaproteobacteria bacterium]
MRRLLFLLPLAVFAALAVWLYLGLGGDPSRIPSPLVGRPAPTFAIDGLATSDLEGPALVNIFASWCVPCRAEHPLLTHMAEKGVAIFGIAYKDKPEAAKAFLAELGNPYRKVGFDEDGQAGLEWGVTGVPETFALDAAGVVVFKQTGPLTPDAVRRELLPALGR